MFEFHEKSSLQMGYNYDIRKINKVQWGQSRVWFLGGKAGTIQIENRQEERIYGDAVQT
jgi:hypothetical protein